jgi:GT2 family glycosyltransferase
MKGLGTLPLWVYDDASDDPSAISGAVKEIWPNAHVILGGKRVGQAEGRNVLLRACQTEFAIMLDDDQYFLEIGLLNDHIVQHSRNPDRAIVQFQSIVKATGETAHPKEAGPRMVPSFMGGCVLVHAPSLLKAGGYRPFFLYGYEEPDLAMRLWGQGFHVWYDSSIVVEHNQWYSPDERRDFREYDSPLWLGLPVGLARSVKRALYHKRNYGAKAAGLLQGVAMTFSHWRERTPLSLRQAREFWRFARGGKPPGSY